MEDLQQLKQDLRREAYRQRRGVANPVQRSKRIFSRIQASQPFTQAQRVLIYLSVRSEVPTHDVVAELLAGSKEVFIPVCVGNSLRLFRLQNLQELTPQTFGILEPQIRFFEEPDRWSSIDTIDLAIVPGVAFDRNGNRLGNGRGFFDRLLAGQAARPTRVGICFDCQLVQHIPVAPADIPMHAVITESAAFGPLAEQFT